MEIIIQEDSLGEKERDAIRLCEAVSRTELHKNASITHTKQSKTHLNLTITLLSLSVSDDDDEARTLLHFEITRYHQE
jgi:hypothetical protein